MSARSPWLWRVLVPSWRFFEAQDARYLLEVRTWRDGEAPSPFVPAVPAATRGKWAWLFAPEHNLRLFCHDLIERFVFELSERSPLPAGEVETLASYQRAKEIARWFVRAEAGARFQLRLVVLREDDSSEELFVSPYYPVEG